MDRGAITFIDCCVCDKGKHEMATLEELHVGINFAHEIFYHADKNKTIKDLRQVERTIPYTLEASAFL